jgi:hypothetical protein
MVASIFAYPVNNSVRYIVNIGTDYMPGFTIRVLSKQDHNLGLSGNIDYPYKVEEITSILRTYDETRTYNIGKDYVAELIVTGIGSVDFAVFTLTNNLSSNNTIIYVVIVAALLGLLLKNMKKV